MQFVVDEGSMIMSKICFCVTKLTSRQVRRVNELLVITSKFVLMLFCLSLKLTSWQVGRVDELLVIKLNLFSCYFVSLGSWRVSWVDKLLVIKSKKTEQQISLLLCFYDSIKEVLLFTPLFLLNQRLRVWRILGVSR